MSTKSQIKSAMDSLQVNKPFKLAVSAPSFQAPITHEEALPLVAAPTLVAKETKVVLETQVRSSTMVATQTPVTIPTQVGSEALVDRATHVAMAQNSSVALEAKASPKLHNGYTRLPNSILMKIAAGELLRSEIQVLLVIARFTISFQQRHAPLSKAVIERQTTLRGPAVLQAISELLAKGLIEKIPGDRYTPNQLGLAFVDEWDFFDEPATKPKTSVATQTQVAPSTTASTPTPVSLETPTRVAAETSALVRPETYFKNNIHIPKDTSSLSSDILDKYFTNLKPEKKREKEFGEFKQLVKDFSKSRIETAFVYLRDRGVPGTGEACHSPMAFLTSAIDSVLKLADEAIEKEQRSAEAQTASAQAKAIEEQTSREQDREFLEREQAFLNHFSDENERANYIATVARRMPLLKPDGPVVRNLAISEWFAGTKD